MVRVNSINSPHSSMYLSGVLRRNREREVAEI